MRATVMVGAGDVHVENVPDAHRLGPTDPFVVVTRAVLCGSDLWLDKVMQPSETGRHMRQEFIDHVPDGYQL